MIQYPLQNSRQFPLVDPQVNGVFIRSGALAELSIPRGHLVDFSSPELSVDDLREYCLVMRARRVEYHIPTIITADPKVQTRNCRIIAEAMENEWGEGILGIHLEGRFLDKRCKGAHPERFISEPDLDEFKSLYKAAKGNILWTTTAPIYENSADFIRSVVALGVVVSIGHHAAEPEQIESAFNAGATGVTHAGNAWKKEPGLPREMSTLLLQINRPNTYVMVVPDEEHVDRDFIRAVYLSALNKSCPDSSGRRDPKYFILTSDQSPAAGAPDGEYTVFNGLSVKIEPSSATPFTTSVPLSGSYLSLRQSIEWVINQGIIDREAAVLSAASINPMRFLERPLTRNGRMKMLDSKGHSVNYLMRKLEDVYGNLGLPMSEESAP